jgi:beta-glucosidase
MFPCSVRQKNQTEPFFHWEASEMSDRAIEFPKDFLWGTAVCSHQAEGHNVHSDWWAWEQEGKIDDGTVSGAAADMLNRYPEDFALMESLGYNSFRLSVEWARIEPERGRYSEEALVHYENVMKELRKRNIKVCLTLYHWVLPKWMADRGGWTNSDSVRWFREYVRRVVYRLYDYVDLWCTLNEPIVPIMASYVAGVFPPEKRNPVLAGKVYVNLLRAHAEAAALIREAARARGESCDPQIGIAMALADVEHKNPDNYIDTKLHKLMRFFHNDAFLNAIHTGVPFGIGAEIPGLKGSFNYIGANYYTRFRLDLFPLKMIGRLEDLLYLPEGTETTEMGYEVYPPGFYAVLKDLGRFGVPIYITENGIADSTDEKRPGYLLRHLKQVKRAMDDGIDVRGYFHWTYIDNFEWKYGFSKKFGLVAVEPGTLNRLPRRSAYMYGEIARTGKITPEIVAEYAPEVESEIWGCDDART